MAKHSEKANVMISTRYFRVASPIALLLPGIFAACGESANNTSANSNANLPADSVGTAGVTTDQGATTSGAVGASGATTAAMGTTGTGTAGGAAGVSSGTTGVNTAGGASVATPTTTAGGATAVNSGLAGGATAAAAGATGTVSDATPTDATAGAASSAGGAQAVGGQAAVGTGGMNPTSMGGSNNGGAGNSVVGCAITASAELSSAIPTVGIVTWSTDMAGVDTASIEFGPADTGTSLVAPVDLDAPQFRTLLLGMKGQREYVYRIVAKAGVDACTSEDYTLTTGAVPSDISVGRQLMMDGAQSQGFIVTSGGITGFGGGQQAGASLPVVIFDTDGDIVWWASAPGSTSRAHMSYEGDNMWMMALNVQNGGGEVRRVSMDGLDVENNVSGLSKTHHDFTVVPGGIIAAPIWLGNGSDTDNALIERAPDGTITTVVENINSLYNSDGYHCNAIHYYPADDTYTIGDRNPNLFVKVSRQGQLLWQFGGTNPIGNHFAATWQVNHGHHLLANGNFLFFNNGTGGDSAAREFSLDESTWTAAPVWEASGNFSGTLGDAERLPNGNTLITYSNAGVMAEVNATGNVVQSFSASSFGYADFRESLYGPPPR